jgi:hypothetical protein
MAIIGKQEMSVGEDVEKWNLGTPLVGMQNGAYATEATIQDP